MDPSPHPHLQYSSLCSYPPEPRPKPATQNGHILSCSPDRRNPSPKEPGRSPWMTAPVTQELEKGALEQPEKRPSPQVPRTPRPAGPSALWTQSEARTSALPQDSHLGPARPSLTSLHQPWLLLTAAGASTAALPSRTPLSTCGSLAFWDRALALAQAPPPEPGMMSAFGSDQGPQPDSSLPQLPSPGSPAPLSSPVCRGLLSRAV